MMALFKKASSIEVKTESINQNFFVERPPINPAIKLFYTVMKNLKLLIRSKFSALIFLFGPLIIITLVALAFNTSTLFDLNIATYSSSYSPLSNSIIENLSDSQYNILKIESEEECIDAVKSSDFQVCVIFPPDMLLDNSANNIVKIYVDNSRINIANLISSQISTKVSVEASALSSDLVTQILTVLDSSNTKTVETQATITKILSSNIGAQESTSSLSSTLEGIDLSYDSLDTTELTSEINSLKTEYNVTDSDISSMTSLISSLESDYAALGAKIDTGKESITTAGTSSTSITSSLNSQESQLKEANTQLQEISETINAIAITNVASIVSPIKTTVEPISAINSYLLYILPTILVLLIMLVSLLQSASSIITEKESRAYFRNFITPTNEFLFMTGEFVSNFIILVLQTSILIAVLYYFFSDTLTGQAFALTGLCLLVIGSFFILLGMLFGYIFNTKSTVTLATISAAMIMLFFSNAILPLETLSSYTRNIVQYNPFIISELLLKKILLFGATFSGITEPLYLLLGFSFAVLVGAILARSFSKKYFNTG
ncbi:ABC transporter permease [Candidatus Woesearchaeota archaeon]|nr:ABC transporter permease [Candidatus Woesearchaeota archaeon]